MWNGTHSIIKIPHALQSNVHYFWFLMLHSKHHSMDNCLKSLRIKFKNTLSTVVNDIVDQFEKWLSKLREGDEVSLNHF